jgi:hypothetical protein
MHTIKEIYIYSFLSDDSIKTTIGNYNVLCPVEDSAYLYDNITYDIDLPYYCTRFHDENLLISYLRTKSQTRYL